MPVTRNYWQIITLHTKKSTSFDRSEGERSGFTVRNTIFSLDHPGIYQRKIVQPETNLTGREYDNFSGNHPKKIRSVFPAE
jgi:hypothetical protein